LKHFSENDAFKLENFMPVLDNIELFISNIY
jgi:hypothetical protein